MAQNITFRDYVEYLEIELKTRKKQFSSDKEREQYQMMKKDIVLAQNLPKYVLDSPLLSDQKYFEEETAQSLLQIKSKIIQARKQNTDVLRVFNIMQEKFLLTYANISAFFFQNLFVLASASAGIIVLWVLSLVLAPVQVVIPESSSLVGLAGAAGIEESSHIVIQGGYVVNFGQIVFFIGLMLLITATYLLRKK